MEISAAVAGLVQQRTSKQVPHRPDQEPPPDQHEIAALPQQRLEIAPDLRGARAGPAEPFCRGVEIAARERDRLIGSELRAAV